MRLAVEFYSHLKFRTRLAFSRPKTRDRLVRQPLLTYLHQNAYKKGTSAEELRNTLFDKGFAAPLLAAKTIRQFERKSQKKDRVIPEEKGAAIANAQKKLRRIGRAIFLLKAMFLFAAYKLASLAILIIFSSDPVPPNFEHNPDLNASEPQALSLTVSGKDYTLYGGDSWNQRLRDECRAFFTAPNVLSEQELAGCWQTHYGYTLSESGFPKYLQELGRNTVEVTAAMRAESRRIKETVKALPAPKISSISTKISDDSVNLWSESDHFEVGLNYAQYYMEVYGVPTIATPPLLDEADFFMAPNVYHRTTRLADSYSTPVYRVIETNSQGVKTSSYIPIKIEDGTSYFFMERIKPAYQLAKHFSQEIDLAASILHKYHGHELTLDQLKLMLAYRLSLEMARLRYEDPWQDIGACAWSECKYEQAFASVFKEVDYGVRIWGSNWDLPWRLASALHTSMDQQGFGPVQIIFGLFKEAAADPSVRKHFSGAFSEDVFEDEKSAMRAILEHPAMSAALVTDYLLTRIEETTFSDPSVRQLPSIAPFIRDHKTGRQMGIINIATNCTGFPEFCRYPEFMFSWPDAHLGTLLFMGDLYLDQPPFPALERKITPLLLDTRLRLMRYAVREKE